MHPHSNLQGKDLLARNEEIRGNLEYQALINEHGRPTPSGIAVVSCADPRCVPDKFLGLKSDDRVIVLRTAGTRVEPVLQDLAMLDALVGVKGIMIIHHTDCGITHLSNDVVRSHIQRYSSLPGIEDIDFGPVTRIEEAMKREFETLKGSHVIRQELRANTKGYLFDMKSGKVELVHE